MRLSLRCVIWCVMPVAAVLGLAPAHAQLRGHGGPIRALAISADGMTVLSGSFDTSAIRWSLRYNLAEQVLRLHESAVNAVAILNDGRAVTGGADALIGIWTPGKPVPDKHLDIVWTPETLAKFFEIGPARYTPGTKMPEQRISSRDDRDALVKFLEQATR